MNYVFYNPNTMPNPGTTLAYIRTADITNRFTQMHLQFHKPYANREDAVSEESACNVFFYENDTLYEATRIPAWQWKPCTDVCCNHGINWHTYYAQTVDRLHEYLVNTYGKLLNFKPTLNSHGLYEIQVHYDGRCR